MTTLQTFPLFTALPPELRIIIWKLTIEGRVVKEGCHFRGMMSGAKAPHQHPPGILLACYESRMIGLRDYAHFMGTWLHPKLDSLVIRGLYFDYLGEEWIAREEPTETSAGRMILKPPFSNMHLTFAGPWASRCDCNVSDHSFTSSEEVIA